MALRYAVRPRDPVWEDGVVVDPTHRTPRPILVSEAICSESTCRSPRTGAGPRNPAGHHTWDDWETADLLLYGTLLGDHRLGDRHRIKQQRARRAARNSRSAISSRRVSTSQDGPCEPPRHRGMNAMPLVYESAGSAPLSRSSRGGDVYAGRSSRYPGSIDIAPASCNPFYSPIVDKITDSPLPNQLVETIRPNYPASLSPSNRYQRFSPPRLCMSVAMAMLQREHGEER
ncbi:hypothetical protein DFJ77DRAFT_280665 [Powellomyces hirtus]|nr:hypothetical protein DFJ77DRAFT_280665 [Powellomyces hirtus]